MWSRHGARTDFEIQIFMNPAPLEGKQGAVQEGCERIATCLSWEKTCGEIEPNYGGGPPFEIALAHRGFTASRNWFHGFFRPQ